MEVQFEVELRAGQAKFQGPRCAGQHLPGQTGVVTAQRLDFRYWREAERTVVRRRDDSGQAHDPGPAGFHHRSITSAFLHPAEHDTPAGLILERLRCVAETTSVVAAVQ